MDGGRRWEEKSCGRPDAGWWWWGDAEQNPQSSEMLHLGLAAPDSHQTPSSALLTPSIECYIFVKVAIQVRVAGKGAEQRRLCSNGEKFTGVSKVVVLR